MRWYYAIDGKRLGPVAHEDFEQLIRSGTVAADTLVWRQGMDQWKTFAEVRERDPAMFAEPGPPALPVAEEAITGPGTETPAGEAAYEQGPAPRRPMRIEVEQALHGRPAVLEYVGFWARGAALVVDWMAWFFVWQILSSVLVLWLFPEYASLAHRVQALGDPFRYQPTPEDVPLILKATAVSCLAALVWAVAYDLIFLRAFSATPGKLLLGLRLVKANGQPLGVPRIVGRTLARIAAGVPTMGIGLVVAAFDEEKRGLHDFLCGTRVVKKRPGE